MDGLKNEFLEKIMLDMDTYDFNELMLMADQLSQDNNLNSEGSNSDIWSLFDDAGHWNLPQLPESEGIDCNQQGQMMTQINSPTGEFSFPTIPTELDNQFMEGEQVYSESNQQELASPVNEVRNEDTSTKFATVRHILNTSQDSTASISKQKTCELYCCLKEFFKQHILKNQSLSDLGNLSKSRKFVQFLKNLVKLGKLANSDLKKIEKEQPADNEVIGLSGAVIPGSKNQKKSSDNEQPVGGQPLILENRLENLSIAMSRCKQALTRLDSIDQELKNWSSKIQELYKKLRETNMEVLTNNLIFPAQEQIFIKVENKWLPPVSEIFEYFSQVMNRWRSLEAWIWAKLTLTPTNLDELYLEIGHMFDTFFKGINNVANHIDILEGEIMLMTSIKSNLSTIKDELQQIKHRVLSVAWCFEQQPPPCCLIEEKMKLGIRLFGAIGADIVDVRKTLIYIFPQSEYDNRFSDEYLYKDGCQMFDQHDSQAEKKGLNIVINGLKLNKSLKRPCKRGSAFCCEQFYRICWVIKLKSNTEFDLECLSLPFTVRTGSEQLWECEGTVKWHCFSEENLYTMATGLKTSMKIDQVLCMLQAIISSQQPDKLLSICEVQALKLLLQSCSNKSADKSGNDTITLRQLVKDHKPFSGKSKTQTKLTKFSIFTWFIAAVNTNTFLTKCNMGSDCFFLNEDQCRCKLESVPNGSALIRVSWNEIEKPSSQVPYANLVACAYLDKKLQIMRLPVDALFKLTPRCLPSWLQRVKNNNGRHLIKTILPFNIPLEKYVDSDTGVDDQVITNDYRTTFKKKPGDIILLDETFERMDISREEDLPTPKESKCRRSKLARKDPAQNVGLGDSMKSGQQDLAAKVGKLQESDNSFDTHL